MKRNPDWILIFPRGCAGISDQRERESHADRRVRPDALRPVRGLGEPQQATSNIQKDIAGHCLPTLSEISVIGTFALSELISDTVEIPRRKGKRFRKRLAPLERNQQSSISSIKEKVPIRFMFRFPISSTFSRHLQTSLQRQEHSGQ